jgi:hypothetical protein
VVDLVVGGVYAAGVQVVGLNAARVHRRPILAGLINEYSQAESRTGFTSPTGA